LAPPRGARPRRRGPADHFPRRQTRRPAAHPDHDRARRPHSRTDRPAELIRRAGVGFPPANHHAKDSDPALPAQSYSPTETAMFIQTEQTPNPATLKFLPGCTVMASGTANFTDPRGASRSPLAERLFTLPEVEGVFLGGDFITVTKAGESDWFRLKPAVLAAIMEHFTAGHPVMLGGEESPPASADEDDEIVSQIKELLETRV